MTTEEIKSFIEDGLKNRGFILNNESSSEDSEISKYYIKGFGGWLFGLFIDCYGMENNRNQVGVQFFTIHKDNIDKFRPSSSVFKVERSVDIFKDSSLKLFREGFIEDICSILNMLKFNKIYAYIVDSDRIPDKNNNKIEMFYSFLRSWSMNTLWKIKYRMRLR